MPASSLLTLLDDITMLLDDVAAMTKIAAKKTSGILGDDLALNAQQVVGVHADRELPVVWAVAKGSLVNKAILVPAALALSEFAPWAVMPLLMVGGGFLCFEGVEKVAHRLFHREEEAAQHAALAQALANPEADVLAMEKEKVKGAIRTDFILSAEIVAITLAAAAESAFWVKTGAMIGIAIIMTVGVYALVAAIVKLDDVGLRLAAAEGKGGGVRRAFGRGILWGAPWLMRALSIGGTAAMFLVGGGILVHGIAPLHHALEGFEKSIGGALGSSLGAVANGVLGVIAGAIILAAVLGVKRVVTSLRKPTAR